MDNKTLALAQAYTDSQQLAHTEIKRNFLVPECICTCANLDFKLFAVDFLPVPGETYMIRFNGKVYKRTAMTMINESTGGEVIFLGNETLLDMQKNPENVNTGRENFIITVSDKGLFANITSIFVVDFETLEFLTDDFTLAIYQETEVIHQMDAKYLPISTVPELKVLKYSTEEISQLPHVVVEDPDSGMSLWYVRYADFVHPDELSYPLTATLEMPDDSGNISTQYISYLREDMLEMDSVYITPDGNALFVPEDNFSFEGNITIPKAGIWVMCYVMSGVPFAYVSSIDSLPTGKKLISRSSLDLDSLGLDIGYTFEKTIIPSTTIEVKKYMYIEGQQFVDGERYDVVVGGTKYHAKAVYGAGLNNTVLVPLDYQDGDDLDLTAAWSIIICNDGAHDNRVIAYTTKSSLAGMAFSVVKLRECAMVKQESIPDAPYFDLAEMGLPAIEIGTGVEVSIQMDTTELRAALDRGPCKFRFLSGMPQGVVENYTTASGIFVPAIDQYIVAFMFYMYGSVFMGQLIIHPNSIQAVSKAVMTS